MQRKLRGKKRYYRKLSKWADSFKLDLGGPNDWYDFWHHHVDWQGRGNRSGRERNLHLAALFTAFENTLKQLQNYKEPYQIWLSFTVRNAYQNTLFFHTPNPNEQNFPYLFDDFVWKDCTPNFLAPFMKPTYEIGCAPWQNDIYYVVRLREKT